MNVILSERMNNYEVREELKFIVKLQIKVTSIRKIKIDHWSFLS